MCDEEWVKVAMDDDVMVVEMLLRLHRAELPLTPPPPPPKSTAPFSATSCAPTLQLDWTVRQRRSKSTMKHVDSSGKKTEPTSTRASPTTPLSWSGGTSVSNNAVADGSEESSKPDKIMEASRSKVAVLTEMATTKRTKRKKTLAELRDEECSLLRERKMLRKELAIMFVDLEKQRAKNKSLKRMKLDILSRQTCETATASTSSEKTISEKTNFRDRDQQFEPVDSLPSYLASNPADNNESEMHHSNVCPQVPGIRTKETSFVLPDLNLPLEEDLGPPVTCTKHMAVSYVETNIFPIFLSRAPKEDNEDATFGDDDNLHLRSVDSSGQYHSFDSVQLYTAEMNLKTLCWT